jgi:hypothetical protein
MRVVDTKPDLGPWVGPFLGVRDPLTNQGWLDLLFEGYSVRESWPQHGGQGLADRDDVAAEGSSPRDLDRHSRLDRQGLAEKNLESAGIHASGDAGNGLWLGLVFKNRAADRQIAGETEVAAVVPDDGCSWLGRHILPP